MQQALLGRRQARLVGMLENAAVGDNNQCTRQPELQPGLPADVQQGGRPRRLPNVFQHPIAHGVCGLPAACSNGRSRCCHASAAALPCLHSCLALLKQGVAQGTAGRSPGSRVAGVRMQAGVHGAQAPASTNWHAAAAERIECCVGVGRKHAAPLSLLLQALLLTSPPPADMQHRVPLSSCKCTHPESSLTHADEPHRLQLQSGGVQPLPLVNVALKEGRVGHGLHLHSKGRDSSS